MQKAFTVIGNFKQNGDAAYVRALMAALQSGEMAQAMGRQKIVLLPPVPYVALAVAMLDQSYVAVGAQMTSGRQGGSWTGCYHAEMLADIGADYVCIGHSERRLHCGEDDALLAQQYVQAVQAGLQPILCIGETAEVRQAGRTQQVLQQQLSAVFSTEGFQALPSHAIILAYEPVWAIGAQTAANIADVQAVFAFLHAYMQTVQQCQNASLCYGGSVDVENCQRFYEAEHISGLLVGRACLDVATFVNLVQRCAPNFA